MTLNAEAFRERLRRRAFHRLERGVRVGADWLVEVLKATVGGATVEQFVHGPASVTPFAYVERDGRVRVRPRQWSGAERLRDTPPGRITGAAQASICFQIVERDIGAGRLVLRIGTDATAPGGTYIQSYLVAHEFGIRYPTRGPLKGTGPVVQRPWARVTIQRYWVEWTSLAVAVARGWA